MPRFAPFAALRYRTPDLSSLICPPYDVISPSDQRALEGADVHNAVRLELPRDEDGVDRYRLAARRLAEWQADGVLAADAQAAFYVYRMGFVDRGGVRRHTTGVLGALGLERPGEGGVLPHEQTTPKAKTDRLELLEATNVNLSPVWGLSLASGLTSLLAPAAEPDARAVAPDGVVHELWVRSASDDLGAAVGAAIGAAPVIIADGHHRYEVALAFAAAHPDQVGAGAVLAFVVELAEDQLSVGAIHRLVSGLPEGFDLGEALSEWFEPVGAIALDATVEARMVEAEALALIERAAPGSRSGPASLQATLLRPRPATVAGAEENLDASRLAVALAALPAHSVAYQHGWDLVADAVSAGEAQAGVLLRPVTVAQIAEVARTGRRMPPKTTFFTPKPATGLVFRPLGG